MKKDLTDCKLYGFIDTSYLRNRSPFELARQLCGGGVDIIQLRAKTLSPNQIRRLASPLFEITESAGVHFIINDHPHIALGISSPFVHLGQEDFFGKGFQNANELAENELSKPRLRLGLSTHSPSECRRAIEANADYVAIGPIYKTATKPNASATSLDYVRWAKANVRIPWFAIGGIDLQNLPAVLEAGAKRICVVSAILQNQNPEKICRSIRALLPS